MLVLGLLAGGWDWTMGLVVLVVWLGYAGLVCSDRRAFMQATGMVDDHLAGARGRRLDLGDLQDVGVTGLGDGDALHHDSSPSSFSTSSRIGLGR